MTLYEVAIIRKERLVFHIDAPDAAAAQLTVEENLDLLVPERIEPTMEAFTEKVRAVAAGDPTRNLDAWTPEGRERP